MKLKKIQLSSDGLHETKAHEWLVRFVFGGLVSVLAGVVGQKFGPAVGGLFLAFPSILPATVTLVKKYHGREKAADDARGAAIGSVGLVAFAFVVTATAERWGELPSLGAATAAWLAVSFLAWLVAG